MTYKKIWRSKKWMWIDLILSAVLTVGFIAWVRKDNRKTV